jgi:hypothetical protein
MLDFCDSPAMCKVCNVYLFDALRCTTLSSFGIPKSSRVLFATSGTKCVPDLSIIDESRSPDFLESNVSEQHIFCLHFYDVSQ